MSITLNDLLDVYKVTFEARNKWRNILLALGMSSCAIDTLGVRWRENPDDCYREGLSDWLKGGERNWKDMIDAMRTPIVGHADIARALEKKTGVPSSSLPPHQKISENLLIFIKQNIGPGAFGAVFGGQYKGRPCAVKVLHHPVKQLQTSSGKDVPGGDEALERESDYLRTFQHQNVVKFFATDKHPMSGSTLLVTELMETNLRLYLSQYDQQEFLPNDCQISLLKDVASGLAYIHSRDIVHRDICGNNILLSQISEPIPIAKISDFGMSRLMDTSQLSSTLSAVGQRMGYLPPEAIRMDDEMYDSSLDVFAFGVIILQIIHKRGTIKSIKDRSYYVSQTPHDNRLRSLVMECLEKDLTKRPTSKELCTKLERLSTS